MTSDLAAEARNQTNPLRVLFFEDCREDVELSLRALRSAGYDVAWAVAVTPAEVISRVRAEPYDVVLSDYRMPGFTGMDVFEAMKSEGIAIPFILVTGSLGEETAVECVKQGVADYVLKDRLARLPLAVRRAREEGWFRIERSRAQEALRKSEASYRSLIQSAPCGILRLSAADGRLLDANAALAGMLGYETPSDLLVDGGAGGISLAAEVLALLSADSIGGECTAEVHWRRKDGAQLVIRLAGRLMRDEHGAPACLEMIAENVSERNLDLQRIEQLNRLYSVLSHANQTIVRTREKRTLFQEICRIIVEEGGFKMAWLGLVDPDTEMLTPQAGFPIGDPYLDDICIDVASASQEQSPAATAFQETRPLICNDVVGDTSRARWRAHALGRAFGSLAAFPVAVRGHSIGVLVIYAAQANLFDIENVALLSELAADVSFALENIETERMHERVTGELNQFFALSLDMLCISDLHGLMQRVNPAWEKTLGFSEVELCSQPWIEFVHPEDRHYLADAYGRLRSGAEIHNLELRFLAKNGACKWLVGSAMPEMSRGVVFAAVTDITERKLLEEQLRAQNMKLEERNRRIEAASRMKSEFLANMSHELRSPLNGIIGFSEVLYDGKLGMLPARPRDYLRRIHASASHLLQLINGVLDLSKIEAGHLEFCPKRICVTALVREVAEILSGLANEKRIRIETEIDASVDELTIDAGRLRQVLFNYLSNALKFSRESGRVAVRVKPAGAAEFRLEVSDTGIGVSEADMPRLFVEFQQLDGTTAKRYQGTGLGLALTKRIVEGQGGRVGVESRPGEGSTFFAVLPRAPLGVAAGVGLGRILVVDDHYLDRFVLVEFLESKGYRVELAKSCIEAYDKCCREQFAAITLDLVLPDGTGWEALARIRALDNHRNTTVIVISACEPADLKVPVEVQGFLTKPVFPDRLFELLKLAGVNGRTAEVVV